MAWVPLAALTVVFASTPLGYVPVPGTAAFLTLAHVPVILGAIMCGPLVGLILGLLFGVGNFFYIPPHDPVVQIVPRVLCGFVAALVFWAARRHGNPGSQLTVGSISAALAGSLTNTLGVTLLALLKGLLPGDEVVGVVLFHGAPEALLAVMVALPFAVSRHH
jgi:uncharacterized membrane protein